MPSAIDIASSSHYLIFSGYICSFFFLFISYFCISICASPYIEPNCRIRRVRRREIMADWLDTYIHSDTRIHTYISCPWELGDRRTLVQCRGNRIFCLSWRECVCHLDHRMSQRMWHRLDEVLSQVAGTNIDLEFIIIFRDIVSLITHYYSCKCD